MGNLPKCLSHRVLSGGGGRNRAPHKRNARPQTPTNFCAFQPFLTKNSEKSNRQNFLSSRWSAQTPPKPPSAHTPDQAQHTKPCLGTFERLGTKETGVLLAEKKIAAGAVNWEGGRRRPFLVQLRANRLISKENTKSPPFFFTLVSPGTQRRRRVSGYGCTCTLFCRKLFFSY